MQSHKSYHVIAVICVANEYILYYYANAARMLVKNCSVRDVRDLMPISAGQTVMEPPCQTTIPHQFAMCPLPPQTHHFESNHDDIKKGKNGC